MVGVQKDKLYPHHIDCEITPSTTITDPSSGQTQGVIKSDRMKTIIEELRDDVHETIELSAQNISRQVETTVAREGQRIMESVSNHLEASTAMLKHTLQMQMQMQTQLCELHQRMTCIEQQNLKEQLNSFKKPPKTYRNTSRKLAATSNSSPKITTGRHSAWCSFPELTDPAELVQQSDSEDDAELQRSYEQIERMMEELQPGDSDKAQYVDAAYPRQGKSSWRSSSSTCAYSRRDVEGSGLDLAHRPSPRSSPISNNVPAMGFPARRSKRLQTYPLQKAVVPAVVETEITRIGNTKANKSCPSPSQRPRHSALRYKSEPTLSHTTASSSNDPTLSHTTASNPNDPEEKVPVVDTEITRSGNTKANKSCPSPSQKPSRSALRYKSEPTMSHTTASSPNDPDSSCIQSINIHAASLTGLWHEHSALQKELYMMDPASAVRAPLNSPKLEVDKHGSENHDSSDSNPQDMLPIESLFAAIERDDTETCYALLDNPDFQEINQLNDKELTVLHKAALKGLPSVVSLIVSHPKFTQANALMPGGLSALHCAAFHGFREVCDILLSHPSFSVPFHKDNAGWTALDHAERFGGTAAATTAIVLRQYGLRRDSDGDDNKT